MGFCVNRNDISVDRFDYGVDIVWEIQNNDDTPFDLSGYQVQLIIKQHKYTADSMALYNNISDGSANSVTLQLSEDYTSNPAGAYYYAIRIIKNEFVNTIIQGRFIIVSNTFESEV